MKVLSQLTGLATLVVMGVLFVLAEVAVLLVVTPLVVLRPSARTRILVGFAHLMVGAIFGVLRHVGRARIEVQPVIPAHGGILMVMNHQSLIDIPVAAACVPSGCPRMVARARYARGIPVVSHMISLYGHILVQPGKMGRLELDALAGTARASTLPILIYPEGHRTRDGEIRPWKRAGIDTFLSTREWEVYVVVVDGLWRVARLTDFVRDLSHVHCRTEVVGPFRYDGRGRENHDAFVTELRNVMCAKLAEMRTVTREERATASVALPQQ